MSSWDLILQKVLMASVKAIPGVSLAGLSLRVYVFLVGGVECEACTLGDLDFTFRDFFLKDFFF
jgi:hypothetical protein